MKASSRLLWLAIAISGSAVANPDHQMCRLDRLQQCQLSPHWQQIVTRLWPQPLAQALQSAVAGQGGVTLLSENQALILLNPETLKRNHLVLLDEQLYERPSLRNYRSTYYHELGHVATRNSPWLASLQREQWPQHWNREVLADLYLYWRLLREGASASELWAQLHLRNIGLIQAKPDWQHWTTPVLYPLLQDLPKLRLAAQWPLSQFLNAVLADSDVSSEALRAYQRLGQRQFALTSSSVGQPYLSAPYRQQWRQMLEPTLRWLDVDTAAYLRRHQLD
ncbi:hypothetical protein [Ferrimonas senticii]|uniref:hypothetical protein n=1 Tax=Ferrimonas senticii TaxID=394566 RepID=UPI000408B597|nr:hypothetical protein [Ferrimonas senticii]